jgi:DNA primase
MLIVDNKVIETPIKTIVDLLRQQLFLLHIDKLNTIEIKQNNIRCTCPIHKGGQERTPSCSILLEDKLDTPAGTVHCFGCGYRASLVKFISDCLGIPFREAKEWLLGVSEYSLVENTRNLELDLQSPILPSNDNWQEVSLDELKGYDYVHPYMHQRKLTDDIIYKFEVGYDPKLDAITFPVYVDGVCRLVCKRRVKFKRFDMPVINPKPIYGLDYLTDNEVIVCESIINALTCWSYGRQAVALFGTGSDWQIEQLNKIPQRHIVLALDGDEAGRKGTARLLKGLKDKIVTVLKIPNGKDINDLTKEEFDNLEESF